MNIRLLVTASLATLVGCSVVTQAPGQTGMARAPESQLPVKLSADDVYFHEHVFEIESHYWTGMCGYMIHGNYHSTQVPRPEWAISVDEFMDGKTPVVGVRAVALEVLSKGRKVRPPIVALSFTPEGAREPVMSHIMGPPDKFNVVTARLETAPAQALLEAYYYGQPIRISLTYQDGRTELLEVRGLGDRGDFTALSGYLHQCLEHLHEIPAGVTGFDYTLQGGSGEGVFGIESLIPKPVCTDTHFCAPGRSGW